MGGVRLRQRPWAAGGAMTEGFNSAFCRYPGCNWQIVGVEDWDEVNRLLFAHLKEAHPSPATGISFRSTDASGMACEPQRYRKCLQCGGSKVWHRVFCGLNVTDECPFCDNRGEYPVYPVCATGHLTEMCQLRDEQRRGRSKVP